jgi:hypothetical protein
MKDSFQERPMNATVASLALLAWLTGPACGQAAKPVLQPREPWTNLFADQDVVRHFTVEPPNAQGRLVWTFADANGRVYERGRGEAPLPAGGKPVKIAFRTPTLKPGVVQEAALTVSLIAGKDEAGATYRQKMWIFPADPFADRTKWLADLGIKLYDPHPKAKTSALFTEMKIPFEDIPRLAGLDDKLEGVIVIGEGASLQEEPELMPALARAAARGARVLCLAPAAGRFVVPGADVADDVAGAGLDTAPGSLTLARQHIIRSLDKRLDPLGWPPKGSIVSHGFVLKAIDDQVTAEVVPGAKGWSWMAVDFAEKKGRLVVCGFSLVGSWDASPTPRYLLRRILEQFDE